MNMSDRKNPNNTLGCHYCHEGRVVVKRCKTGNLSCKECFIRNFEEEVHEYIIDNEMFKKGDRVGVCISGGKDSSVLLNVLYELNKRKDYGIKLELIAVDEGIKGYRDDSLEVVKYQQEYYNCPLTILSFKEIFNITMDEIQNKSNRSNSCTYCGVFRRKALDIGSYKVSADIICTGHSCDDTCETLLLNILRGDYNRLQRCINPITSNEIVLSNDQAQNYNNTDETFSNIKPRVKPLMLCYEKEIVLYAHYLKLRYFSTECTYSVDAYRGVSREFIRKLQSFDYKYSYNMILAAQELNLGQVNSNPNYIARKCTICGYISSSTICNGCNLINALKYDNPGLILKNQRQKKKITLEETP
ncbi:Pploop atpase [Cryptosporidium canis]|uniref:Pploop atpase n=1 Tax=Cryptosporidium canis TaxID=195482 RepID=A0ABQ8P7T3_9CRYT|nr:Pploop atpase [Cryptosporidium canis]KAJ1613938.1 Pploop atpase [Cryptosporidium canis]